MTEDQHNRLPEAPQNRAQGLTCGDSPPHDPDVLLDRVPDFEVPSPGQHPVAVYLASLADGPGRAGMKSALGKVADLLTDGRADAETTPWEELRFRHISALRVKLAERYAPASANKALSAVRGVIRAAWRLGQISTDEYQRAVDVPAIKGSRLPAGRALDTGELRALFQTCIDDETAAGPRDAAIFALMFGCGMRRAEVAALSVDAYDSDTGAIRIIGKGDKERTVYAVNGAQEALEAWIEHRGREPGALMCPVAQTGRVTVRRMTAQALMMRLKRRARQAGIQSCSPHDLRRTFVSLALEGGADIAMVQALAGHSSPNTTVRYDRRPEAAKRAAAAVVHVPYVRREE